MPSPIKTYTREYLNSIGVTQEGFIKTSDKVNCVCIKCSVPGMAIFSNITRKNGWRCKTCSIESQKNKITGRVVPQKEKYKLKASAKARSEKRLKTMMDKYGTLDNFTAFGKENPMKTEEGKSKQRDSMIKNHGVNHPSKSPEIMNKVKETWKKRYGQGTDGHHKIIEKRKMSVSLRYGTDHNMKSNIGKQEFMDSMFEKYGYDNPMKDPSNVRAALVTGRKIEGTAPVKKFTQMLINRGFIFEKEYSYNGKLWDFAIFNKDTLSVLIEIDGEFHHGLVHDPYCKTISGHNDATRFQRINDDIKYIQCDSKKINDAFNELLRIFGMSYLDWVNEMVEKCLTMSFPYPTYSDKRMLNDWKHLCNTSKYTPRNIPANSIMTHFHKSIYTSNKNGKVSPVDAWNNPELLRKCVENRFIYCPTKNITSVHIARGFEKNQIAPRVSVFQPSVAREILSKYGDDCKTVVDPFSGFSGRMLGAASLGISYTGYDIRAGVIKESNEIINFLSLNNCKVECTDSLKINDSNYYDVLLTCPPYGGTERWIDVSNYNHSDFYIKKCLELYNAGIYLFVVSDTELFKDNVVGYIENKSHFSTNKELIIKIKLSN